VAARRTEHHPAVVPAHLGGTECEETGRFGDDVIGLDVDVVAGHVIDGLYLERHARRALQRHVWVVGLVTAHRRRTESGSPELDRALRVGERTVHKEPVQATTVHGGDATSGRDAGRSEAVSRLFGGLF
jgi:hypothetical protein